MGGPAVTRQVQLRLTALERHFFLRLPRFWRSGGSRRVSPGPLPPCTNNYGWSATDLCGAMRAACRDIAANAANDSRSWRGARRSDERQHERKAGEGTGGGGQRQPQLREQKRREREELDPLEWRAGIVMRLSHASPAGGSGGGGGRRRRRRESDVQVWSLVRRDDSHGHRRRHGSTVAAVDEFVVSAASVVQRAVRDRLARRAWKAVIVQRFVRTRHTTRVQSATLIQTCVRARQARQWLHQVQRSTVRLQTAARRQYTRTAFRQARTASIRLQTAWRGARTRRASARLKSALLLDEAVAYEAMRLIVGMRTVFVPSPAARTDSAAAGATMAAEEEADSAAASDQQPQPQSPLSLPASVLPSSQEQETTQNRQVTPPGSREDQGAPTSQAPRTPSPIPRPTPVETEAQSEGAAIPAARLLPELPMPPRSHELYQSGLRANHEGRPIPACEWIQRAAVISGWPTLSVLLSLANMRLKLGQPSAALLAYRHILLVADPNGRHAHMARRKLQEALLLGGTDGSPSIPMRSPLSSLVASPNNGGAVGDDHLKQRGRSWLRWVEEQTPRAVARQSRRLRSPGNQNSPRATSKPGSHAASPYSRTYTNPTPSRPLLARMPTWRMGLGLSRPGDATLNEEQLSLLERLLLDSMLGGGSRSGPSELAHGGVRLQLGASLEEVELTLTAGQGKPASRSASLNSRLDTSLDSSNASSTEWTASARWEESRPSTTPRSCAFGFGSSR